MFERLISLFTYNVGTKIVSFLIAVVLWIVVFGSRNVEVTKEIPIEILTSPQMVPSNDLPEKVAFRLSGPKAFLRAVLDRRDSPIKINLRGKKSGLVTYEFFSDNISLPIGVKVVSINPPALIVKLDKVRVRKVPVRLELRGNPPDGYRIVKTTITPKLVKVRGARSRVNALKEVVTTPIDLVNMKQTTEQVIPLELYRYGVELEGDLPKVKIEIEATSANYRIKNVGIRVVSSHRAKLNKKSVTVFVRATAEDLKYLDESKVFAQINLKGKRKGTYTRKVKVELPKELGLVKVVPDRVRVTLY